MAHSPRPDPLKQRCPAEQQQYLGGVCSKGSLVHRAFSIRIRDARWHLIGEPVLPLARIIAESTYAALACQRARRPLGWFHAHTRMTRRRSSNSTYAPWPMPLQNFDIWVRKGGLRLWKVVVWTRFVAVIGGVGYRGGNIYHPHWRCILHQRTGRLGGLNKYFSRV